MKAGRYFAKKGRAVLKILNLTPRNIIEERAHFLRGLWSETENIIIREELGEGEEEKEDGEVREEEHNEGGEEEQFVKEQNSCQINFRIGKAIFNMR